MLIKLLTDRLNETDVAHDMGIKLKIYLHFKMIIKSFVLRSNAQAIEKMSLSQCNAYIAKLGRYL